MEFIARDPESLKIRREIEKIAPSSLSVFIYGESGTGKDVVAELIHRLSGRKGPFVKINCANLREELIESELFGYVKGAFSDASEDRKGKLEAADGGSLYLDGIENLSVRAQAKIAPALETGTFYPLGSHQEVKSDFRLIVSSRFSPLQLLNSGKINESFFHVCTGYILAIPPLRKRKQDIPALIAYFLKELGVQQKIEEVLLEALLSYPWPGNIRELKAYVEREVLVWGRITGKELPSLQPASIKKELEEKMEELPTLQELEAFYIKRVLSYTKGNRSRAAQILGISRKTLYNKLKKK